MPLTNDSQDKGGQIARAASSTPATRKRGKSKEAIVQSSQPAAEQSTSAIAGEVAKIEQLNEAIRSGVDQFAAEQAVQTFESIATAPARSLGYLTEMLEEFNAGGGHGDSFRPLTDLFAYSSASTDVEGTAAADR